MDKRWQSFLQDLVRTAHGQSLPAAIETKMITDLSIQLQAQLHELVFSLLPNTADQLQYQNLIMGNPTGADLMTFLKPLIPNIDQHFERCLNEFRDDYLRICQA